MSDLSVWKHLKAPRSCPIDVSLWLAESGYQVSDQAADLLGRVSHEMEFRDMNLIRLTPFGLGFSVPNRLEQFYASVLSRGATLCPPSLAWYLRSQYPDQPCGEKLYLAMDPVMSAYQFYGVFTVEHGERGLQMGWGHGNLDFHLLDLHRTYVFVEKRA